MADPGTTGPGTAELQLGIAMADAGAPKAPMGDTLRIVALPRCLHKCQVRRFAVVNGKRTGRDRYLRKYGPGADAVAF